jgi:putative serine protease PepD
MNEPTSSQPEPPRDGWWSRPGDAGTSMAGTVPTQQIPLYQASGSGASGDDPWVMPWGGGPPSPPARPARERRRPGWMALLVAALAAGLLGGAIGAWLVAPGATDATGEAALTESPLQEASQTPARPPESVAGIAGVALDSVVSISSATGTGSGFIITDDGYVLTNNHVIADAAASGAEVTVDLPDGRQVDSIVVGRSPAYDLAVLDIDLNGLSPLPLGDSDQVVVGDPVVAVGNPLGLDGTVTAGIVSAVDRPVTAGGSGEVSFINAIQTDAAINPGNSGGPLLDAAGRVIGVNSSIATLGSSLGGSAGSIGLGFAIPINQARLTAEQIIATGEASYPVIGATLDVQSPGQGAIVGSVVPGGPAESVGIRTGDRVVEFDGERIASAEELIVAIRSMQPGDTVDLTYVRNGTQESVTVELGSAVG